MILAGALITFFAGEHGQINVTAEPTAEAQGDGGGVIRLPFSLAFRSGHIDCYPASTAPRGYECDLTVSASDGNVENVKVTMTNMLIKNHYRFTLVSLGQESATLTVNRDPWGIGVTYAGYFLLFAACLAFFFQKHTGFRAVVRRLRAATFLAAVLFSLQALAVSAEVPGNVALTFGKIYVFWDERPAPMQTMARAIMTDVHGSETYQGLSAEQVVLGWISSYDRWKNEPMILLKSDRVGSIIGVGGKYAALTDFFDAGGYKLAPYINDGLDSEIMAVDRRVQLLSSLATGSLMRIFPYMSANGRMEWLSWTDYRPSQMPIGQWQMVSTSMGDVFGDIYLGNYDKARAGLLKIRRYQIATAAEAEAPLSEFRFRSEIIYNSISGTLFPAILLFIVGLCPFVLSRVRFMRYVAAMVMAVAFVWLSALIILRWIIAGHMPLSNGPESMELMAWLSLGFGLAVMRRRELAGASAVVASLTLFVAAMSGNAGVISPLVPVLASPLLSVHVLVIMAAYALLAMATVLSAAELMRPSRDKGNLADTALALVYPAVLLLAAGIFIGAIWANQSWGRYWGWDPKETWALITMLVYSAPLHWMRLGWFRNRRVLSVYLLCSFVCVLITYFGVNFFMSGLHSYS
ncbi:MAG: cytochrome c biogenesis protein CcsA [Bacteroides sp.]|nr:cytochrome c biogenesis protein CcsA [Bacteroides sp.]MCM1457956.1 cytochrome c biogenesis protein CcsA [Lachnoclostridium sp.]